MHAGALSLCPSAANGDARLWGQLSSCCQQISHQGVCDFKIARLCHDICCAMACVVMCSAPYLLRATAGLHCIALRQAQDENGPQPDLHMYVRSCL